MFLKQLAASASMTLRSSFASIPLQITFAKGRKALTAVTGHYVPCAAVRCSGYSCLSGISVLHQAGLNVAKQPDFSIRHQTLLRYRFVHVRRHHDSLFSHAPSTTRIDIVSTRSRARYGPHSVLDSNCTGLRHRIDVLTVYLSP